MRISASSRNASAINFTTRCVAAQVSWSRRRRNDGGSTVQTPAASSPQQPLAQPAAGADRATAVTGIEASATVAGTLASALSRVAKATAARRRSCRQPSARSCPVLRTEADCLWRRMSVPNHPRSTNTWVSRPAPRLRASVPRSRHRASSQPSILTERKKTSGSIEGDAIQKAITGASGTPPISSEATTGITLQEQNGLNAPTAVASTMATSGLA